MTPAQKEIVRLLKEGARIERDGSPPYRWWIRRETGSVSKMNSRSIEALVRDGHVKMERIEGDRWTNYRLVLP